MTGSTKTMPYRHHRNGVTFTSDGWFVYLAMADTGRSLTLAKVGISETPLLRLACIHQTCPYPIRAAKWAFVGRRSSASKIESRVKAACVELRDHTRGEWFEVDTDKPEHKRLLTAGISLLFAAQLGREPDWHHVSEKDIRSAVDSNLIKKQLASYA